MQSEFWHERWERNQIGFHQQDINLHLETFWKRLRIAPQASVFVPLCGKSRDMLWLRSQGHPVWGVEISPIAVRDFFAEHDLIPTVTQQGKFERWEADGLTILLGDFFTLSAEDIAHCAAVYDRASLIALPLDMRAAYVEHLLAILPPVVTMLLITVAYDQNVAKGPPFAVYEAEVRGYYEEWFAIEHICTVDAIEDLPGFRKYGIERLDEHVFLLMPH
ncbi:MAG: thiopurine S-methyltransferase [Proteobacteria bacterium]|nr:MAG: thiopurine S-methyltransferase [Pseudomonadota bacterium]